MTNVLIVGGTFDNEGGRPSSLIGNLITCFREDAVFNITSVNGGFVSDLHNEILPTVVDFDVVLWFANVPNDEDKLRDVKSINPKAILVTSKRNDDNKYTFAELISRALAIKANLTVEFSKQEAKFNMMLFDPLGNVFYDGLAIEDMCTAMIRRLKQLLTFTRVPTIKETNMKAPLVTREEDFFYFARDCADTFHNLIRPAKGTERFLGNMSFRCQHGFPSFRGKDGIIFVSRRNVNKAVVDTSSFVPTFLDEDNNVKYFGENKPSVDTPVQLRLYEKLPWANFMIHAHCYVDVSMIPEVLFLRTTKPIPCGALEEVDEIIETYLTGKFWWDSKYNDQPPRLLAINLIGHGCILIARDVEILKELQKHKDSCFVQRPMPEMFMED